MRKVKITQEERDKIIQMMLEDRIDYKKNQRSDLRAGAIDWVTQYSKKLRTLSINDISTIKNGISTIIDLSEREQEIMNLLNEEPKSIKDLTKEMKMSKGSVWNYLKLLLAKGLVKKQQISHKNVIYSKI